MPRKRQVDDKNRSLMRERSDAIYTLEASAIAQQRTQRSCERAEHVQDD